MNIDRTLLRRQTMAQSTQNIFWSIGLNEYLDVLGGMIGEENCAKARELAARFSHFDDDYLVDFKKTDNGTKKPADVTIGDLAYAITEMIGMSKYNGSGERNNSFDRMVARTGRNLLAALIVDPFVRIANDMSEIKDAVKAAKENRKDDMK